MKQITVLHFGVLAFLLILAAPTCAEGDLVESNGGAGKASSFPAGSHIIGGNTGSHFGIRGLNDNFGDQGMRGRMFREAKAAGVRWCQTLARWEAIEPNPPSGGRPHYDWKRLDEFIETAFEHDIDVNIIFKSYSKWGARRSHRVQDEIESKRKFFRSSSPDPERLSDWKAFVRAVVERYDGDGQGDEPTFVTPTKKVRYWQIESEPGTFYPWRKKALPGSPFWAGTPSEYAHHFVETAKAIKEADKEARVILGGFVSRSILAKSSRSYFAKTLEAIAQLEEKTGGGTDLDGVDIHHFREVALLEGVGEKVQNILRENRFGEKMLWATQVGLGLRVLNKRFPANVSRDTFFSLVCRDLVKRYVVLFANGAQKVQYVKLMDVGEDFDKEIVAMSNMAHRDRRLRFDRYVGILDARGERNPKFYTYRLLAEKLDFFSGVETIDIDRPEIHVYKFIFQEKRPVYVAWATEDKSVGPIDLSGHLKTATVKMAHIIEAQQQEAPAVEVVSSARVALSASPVFLEAEQVGPVGQPVGGKT